jgi:hypothetical protein
LFVSLLVQFSLKNTFLCGCFVRQRWCSGFGLGRNIRSQRLESVMAIKRRLEQMSLETTFAASVPPLGKADLALVQRAIAEITPDWAVALEGISAEEATLVLVPDDGDDRSGPSFVISRETYGLRVDQVQWDLEVLRLRLAFCMDRIVPGSATLH